ncbi:cytochrome b/b6 domain-containing protein [uncultured Sphingomonas sp.]|uniref:cytochrome b/b6 domain-containing protein n=1 Tax=uncultured Sphingomonas sp. TaxID=158754 RepID=UPI0025D6D611|nr:cytochrome b/b6 domain-containing protein [uncultured Sphingomonas sp.]
MDDRPPRPLLYRHRLPTRLWHWLNALAMLILLLSGLMIFNAHPRLYWGRYGANFDKAWLQIGPSPTGGGQLAIGGAHIPTTGVLGRWSDAQGRPQARAFPYWMTLPSRYSLAGARRWHVLFAWVLVLGGLAYVVASLVNRHFRRDLWPSRAELEPRHLWGDIRDHARLRLPTGDAAGRYNILQKLAYLLVIFVLIPLMILTGLTMGPGFNATFPQLLDLFGGRQSARSIHFLCAMALLGFVGLHLAMVVAAGPVNETRSMITGWFRTPPERRRHE